MDESLSSEALLMIFFTLKLAVFSRSIDDLPAGFGRAIPLQGLWLVPLANDVLCRVAFGKRFKEESGEGQKHRLVEVCLGEFFPAWEWVNSLSGDKRRLTSNLDDLKGVCDEIIRERVEEQSGRVSVREKEDFDFVDVLVRVLTTRYYVL